MSETRDDGGPAFPTHAVGHVEASEGAGHSNLSFALSGGLSLRDYFAGQALASALSGGNAWPFDDYERLKIANACYGLADAMLKARAK